MYTRHTLDDQETENTNKMILLQNSWISREMSVEPSLRNTGWKIQPSVPLGKTQLKRPLFHFFRFPRDYQAVKILEGREQQGPG